MKKIAYFQMIALLLAGMSSCESIKSNDENIPISYTSCNYEETYSDTIMMDGISYLFNDSIPKRIENELRQEGNSDYAAWIVYVRGIDTATLYIVSKKEISTSTICNYPEFAKKWKTPFNGLQVYYAGTALETGRYLSVPPMVGYNFILTTLKNK
jgi:hypothetical protein